MVASVNAVVAGHEVRRVPGEIDPIGSDFRARERDADRHDAIRADAGHIEIVGPRDIASSVHPLDDHTTEAIGHDGGTDLSVGPGVSIEAAFRPT